jgi:hypothetical protein
MALKSNLEQFSHFFRAYSLPIGSKNQLLSHPRKTMSPAKEKQHSTT